MATDQAAAEWAAIASQRTPEQHRAADAWLQKYGDDHPIAPHVFARVLQVQPALSIAERARRWVAKHDAELRAPEVVGSLLRCDQSDIWDELALKYLTAWEKLRGNDSEDAKDFERSCAHLMAMILVWRESGPLMETLEQLLESYCEDPIWHRVCWASGYSPQSQDFTARWIQLNQDNESANFLGIPTLVPAPQVLDATLIWMSAHLDNVHDLLVSEAVDAARTYHPDALPNAVALARKWLSGRNPEEGIGRVYGALIRATQSEEDIRAGLDWYKQLPERCRINAQAASADPCAGFVLSEILSVSSERGEAPPTYVVSEAKRLLLSSDPPSFARLLFALLACCRDNECLALAEKFVRHNADLKQPIEKALEKRIQS